MIFWQSHRYIINLVNLASVTTPQKEWLGWLLILTISKDDDDDREMK